MAPCGDAFGHGMVTAYLEIRETSPGMGAATWRLPDGVQGIVATPELSGCQVTDASTGDERARASGVTHYRIRCNEAFLGKELRISGFAPPIGEAVVRTTLTDGSVASQILSVTRPTWTIPGEQPWTSVLPRYLALGVEHIASGADHLLFVLGLVLLIGASRRREILWTATAFTAAHSITLTATALEWFRIPSAVAEAMIAGTLVLLALDIGKGTARHPRSLAFVFGLVHGFGFAGALSEIGLPDGALAPALLAFNVGVEIGQVLFIGAVLATLALVALAAQRRPIAERTVATCATYAVGGLGMFWFVQRVSVLLAS